MESRFMHVCKPDPIHLAGLGTLCPVCQQGYMQLTGTLYLNRAFWDLSQPMSVWDTS